MDRQLESKGQGVDSPERLVAPVSKRKKDRTAVTFDTIPCTSCRGDTLNGHCFHITRDGRPDHNIISFIS